MQVSRVFLSSLNFEILVAKIVIVLVPLKIPKEFSLTNT